MSELHCSSEVFHLREPQAASNRKFDLSLRDAKAILKTKTLLDFQATPFFF